MHTVEANNNKYSLFHFLAVKKILNEQVICIQSKRYNVTMLGVYSCTSNHNVKNSSALLVLLNLFIVLCIIIDRSCFSFGNEE